ncbi:MAG: hypothetical protein CBD72_02750 [Flavobacteriaceae bacterium TMED212]|nr:MAG: hypothetical protein CBD72_02750 [Flavobacteriaceae bacterium TMED212]
MKKLILSLLFFYSLSINAQYCLFFDIKVDEPEMVVSAMNELMMTDWGKNIEATKSLFTYGPNGTNEATHSIQFCFPNEAAFENAFISYGQSGEAQLIWERKLQGFSEDISQSLNTPIWYNGEDWAEDNVFMIYQLEVSNPSLYIEEFQSLSKKLEKKLGIEGNSYGIAMPIVGKNSEFTHFVWQGYPDIKTALSITKSMFSDPLFAEFSKKVSGSRKVINTLMSIRVMDF